MQVEETILRVQAAYPRIYLACHSQHQNGRTIVSGISQRDATLLAHLSEQTPAAQSDLARHLGVAKSTLSEALTYLEERGFVTREASREDARTIVIRRTTAGTQAMSSGSVLESDRLRAALERLSPAERDSVVQGLETLAHAAQSVEHEHAG